jgi:branched-chain amino acid aminotransferase
MQFYSFNNSFFSGNQITLHTDNKALRYGYGCFETIKVLNNQIVNELAHYNRFTQTVAALYGKMPIWFTQSFFTQKVIQLCNKNKHLNARVRLTAYIGQGGILENLTSPATAEILIQTWPLNPEVTQINENGLQLGVFTNAIKTADGFSALKTNNFLVYALAANWAKSNFYNDALVTNQFGNIIESTIANIFVITNKQQIITPPLSEGCIAGVQRAALIQRLTLLNYHVTEQPITNAILTTAAEVFLTNAITPIKWVASINGINYKNQHTLQIYNQL